MTNRLSMQSRPRCFCHCHPAALFVIFSFLVTGCASKTARIEQFSDFAKAGMAYEEAFDALLDFSLDNKVAADNRVLIMNRNLSDDRDDRIKALSETDKVYRKRQEVVTQIKKQGRYLKNYFVGLALLADSGEESKATELSTGIIDSTTTLAKSLSEVSDEIAELRFGDRNAEEAVGILAPLAIAHFRARELDKTLTQTAPVVQRALRIHKRAIESLETQLSDNERLGHEQLRTEIIFKPYVNTGTLPTDWGKKRSDWFKQKIAIEQLNHASDAATQLELGFTALVEKKSPGASFDLLLADITQILDLVESFDYADDSTKTDSSIDSTE